MFWILVVIFLFVFWYYYKFYGNPREAPLLPKSLPIIGYNHFLLTTKPSEIWNIILELAKGATEVGGIAKTHIGVWSIYIITDPKVASTILNSCLDKDVIYHFFYQWLGHSTFTGPVPTWKSVRRMILPAFNQRILDDFYVIYNKESKNLVNKLAPYAGKEPFDIFEIFAVQAVRTYVQTSLGLQLDIGDDELVHHYRHYVEEYCKSIVERVVNPFYHFDFWFNLTGANKKAEYIAAELDKIAYKIIDNRRKLIKENKQNNNQTSDATTGKHKIAIDLLLELVDSKQMTEKQMKDEINVQIFGSHDTTANTLTYILALIGTYPDVQDKLLDEIKSVLGDEDIGREHQSQLIYLEACIKEGMRLYPVTPVLLRHIDKDQVFDNFTLSAGGRCIVMTREIQRHSIWGPDAEKFKPERWLDPTQLPECPAAFLGFSWGKRNCYGQKFAMMLMKTQIAHIIRNYRIKADHTKLVCAMEALVAKAVSGHHIYIERRT